ncbi:hypothetical protein EON63_06480 [archaeon]|nr:MAG: hypothetical protein EON63_06480 [archaeon]
MMVCIIYTAYTVHHTPYSLHHPPYFLHLTSVGIAHESDVRNGFHVDLQDPVLTKLTRYAMRWLCGMHGYGNG